MVKLISTLPPWGLLRFKLLAYSTLLQQLLSWPLICFIRLDAFSGICHSQKLLSKIVVPMIKFNPNRHPYWTNSSARRCILFFERRTNWWYTYDGTKKIAPKNSVLYWLEHELSLGESWITRLVFGRVPYLHRRRARSFLK